MALTVLKDFISAKKPPLQGALAQAIEKQDLSEVKKLLKQDLTGIDLDRLLAIAASVGSDADDQNTAHEILDTIREAGGTVNGALAIIHDQLKDTKKGATQAFLNGPGVT